MTSDMEEFEVEGGRGVRITGAGKTDIVAIVHEDGRRELQFHDRRTDAVRGTLNLDDDDARRLGAVLSGTRHRPATPAEVRGRIGDIVVEWVHVDADSLAVGKSLEQLDLHRMTGMTVVSIVDSTGTATTPRADTIVQAGDRVVVVGQLRQLESFIDLLTG